VRTTAKRLSVDGYERLIEHGILPETNRFELIEGRIVEKDVKNPPHTASVGLCAHALDALLPGGWHARQEGPVRIPNRRSEPEPDVAVVRGTIRDYERRHPGPGDVALVVEVTRTSAAKDRKLAPVYAAADIPAYWIVNVPRRRLEVYSNPAGGAYPPPAILTEADHVELVLDGQVIGRIAVADLLPRRP
jgi:Uma2 family endonuclease